MYGWWILDNEVRIRKYENEFLTYPFLHFQEWEILEVYAILQLWLLEMFRDRNWLFQKVLHSQGQKSWYALANALWNMDFIISLENLWSRRRNTVYLIHWVNFWIDILPHGRNTMCLWSVEHHRKKNGITTKSTNSDSIPRTIMALMLLKDIKHCQIDYAFISINYMVTLVSL